MYTFMSSFSKINTQAFLLLVALYLLPGSVVNAAVEPFMHQGVDRQYRIHNTEAAADVAVPLLVHLHGFRYRDEVEKARETFEHIAWERMEEVAVENGFVLVQPAAYRGQWNLFEGLDNTTMDTGEGLDDVGYIFGIIDKLVRDGVADRMRIYLSGISDGAIMTIKLLCHPDAPFAAAVHLVGAMPEFYALDCASARETPFMAISGTNDRILRYDGQLSRFGRDKSIPEVMEFWRLKHGCTGQKYEMLPDRETADNSRVLAVTWTGCKRDGAVKLLRIEGGGHAIPTYKPVPEERRIRWGGHNQDIESSVEIWNFVKQFSSER